MKPFLFIATPTHGGGVKIAYLSSLISMIKKLDKDGVKTSYANIDGAHIPEQRDALAQMFLDKSECTHLLMIDSDMEFDGHLASRLLRHNKPFVGAAYPKRGINLDKLRTEVKKTGDLDAAMARSVEFTLSLENPITGQGDLVRVKGMGMGFVIVSRRCIEEMTQHQPIRRYVNHYIDKNVYGLFEEGQDDGLRVSEDLSFCARWRACGGEVWADVSTDIKHVGDFAYAASFMRRIRG